MLELTSGTATIEDYRAALELARTELAELKNSKPAKASKAKRAYVFTPFQAAKFMNEEREALGLNPITPQMLYTYARKGYFAISASEDGRKQVNIDSFCAWMRKHNAK